MSEGWIQFYASLSHTSLGLLMFIATGIVGGVTLHLQKCWRETRSRKLLPAQLLLWPIFLSGVWFCIAVPLHLGCAALKGRSVQCQRNMKDFGTAMLMYAQDHDETFPPAKNWELALKPYQKEPLRCPDAKTGSGYGANRPALGLALAKIGEPSGLVQLFETDAMGPSFVGGKRNLATERHGGTPNVLFADGHAKHVNRGVSENLLWENALTPAK